MTRASRVVEQVPPTRFVTRIADAQEFGGTWTIDLAPHGGETTVTITERGEVYNPAFRFMSASCLGTRGRWRAISARWRSR